MNQSVSSPGISLNRGVGQAIVALYFVSGVAGLAYQVLWARMLSLQFGVSIFGVVITAAAFMLGLGGGALYGDRLGTRIQQPLRWFALLEAGVAVYALALPFLLQVIQNTVTGLAPSSLPGWYGLQAIAALILVMIPAFALGVGFPMVLQALRSTPISLARIYGVNTCGGALGALLPLWLLPNVGWVAALWFSALLGLSVAAIAFLLSRRVVAEAAVDLPAGVNSGSLPLSSVLAYAAVGGAALMLEVGWTRLFGMLLLRTEYVMAVILTVFLLGIGIGSLLARRLCAPIWFDLLPMLGAGFALLSLWGIEPLAAWAEAVEFSSLALAMSAQSVMIALLTLPVTLILGAWLPLLSIRLGDGGARLYGANALGAATGALIAGFVLIPLLGTHGTVIVAAVLLFIAGMTWARRSVWLALPVMLVLAWPVRNLPSVSELLPQTQANSRDVMLHEDVLGITHVTQRADGQRLLLADLQRMDASSEPLAVISQQNQARLPLLLHPAPHKVLFLGMGTGISAAGALPFPNLEITAVELSAGAITAAEQWFAPVNADVSRKIHVVRDDARRFLLVDKSHYDVIIGDLFHPDLVGRSTLLSRQQFARAKARLNAGGIFVQWLALNQFDPESLAAVIRSFQREFDNAVFFADGFRLAMVGRQGGAIEAAATLGQLARLAPEAAAQVTGGEGGWTWLGRYWGRLEVGPGPVQDEWAPVIEYRLPRVRYGGGMNVADTMEWLLARRPDLPTAMRELAVPEGEREPFERAFVATELSARAWLAQFRERVRESQQLLRLAYQANPQDRWIRGAVADRMYGSLGQMAAQGMDMSRALEAILKVSPEHADALRQAWQLAIEAGRLDKAEEYRSRLVQISPLDAALAGKAQSQP
ncbi:MAG: fused MFS/spermidine synthase [Gammaproteobacteria bacterium]|nr:fused MFS/spermidine synthase [Gammaproteobacteria bacterium]